MPEVILPCPHCRTDRYLSVQSFKALKIALFRVICNGCGVSGPAGDTRESAIEAHNALPRALRWTHEPPKVEGWYWCRECKSGVTLCVEVYGESSFLLFGSKRDDFNPQRPVTVDGIEWAGPIAPPID